MAITPIPQVSLEALRAVGLGDGLRDGRILEARVTAMLSNTLANLLIEGQPVLVRTTMPLPVGAAMTLKAEQEDGQLKLIVQGPIRDAPTLTVPAPTSQQPPAAPPAEPEKAALAKIQTMTVETMLGDEPAGEPTLMQYLQAAARGQPQTGAAAAPFQTPGTPPPQAAVASSVTPSQAAAEALLTPEGGLPPQDAAAAPLQTPLATPPQAGASSSPAALSPPAPSLLTPQGGLSSQAAGAPFPLLFADAPPAPPLNAGPLPPHQPAPDHTPPQATLAAAIAAAAENAPEARSENSALKLETPEFRQVHVPSDAAAAQLRAERAASFTVEVPIFLPGTNMPLRLHVTQRQEEPDREASDGPRSSYWTVRFAAEAGHLGMVHAAISLIEGHVGVQLWAEREDTADRFKLNAPQLRDALEASNLKLDGVSIAEGSPLGDR